MFLVNEIESSRNMMVDVSQKYIIFEFSVSPLYAVINVHTEAQKRPCCIIKRVSRLTFSRGYRTR